MRDEAQLRNLVVDYPRISNDKSQDLTRAAFIVV